MSRITRKNPNPTTDVANTYRIPFATGKRWREGKSLSEAAIFGEVADKLGRYEDIGEPDEIEEMLVHLRKCEI